MQSKYINLKYLHRSSAVFSIYALTLLMVTRLIILLFFGANQTFSPEMLGKIFFMGLRFDLKLIAVLLLAFAYLPALFLTLFRPSFLFR